jgi:hypothetical protein
MHIGNSYLNTISTEELGISTIGHQKNIADNLVITIIGVVITMRIYAEANDQLQKDINLAVK